MRDLEKRLSHSYIDGYRYLDGWEKIGEYEEVIVGPTVIIYEPDGTWDMTEPKSRTILVRVKTDAPEGETKDALGQAYSYAGCTHEYDCCGCRSYHVNEIKPLGNDHWLLIVGSSRNY